MAQESRTDSHFPSENLLNIGTTSTHLPIVRPAIRPKQIIKLIQIMPGIDKICVFNK